MLVIIPNWLDVGLRFGALRFGVIGEIVCLRAKLEAGPLVDGELLEQGQVPILNARLVDRVAYAGCRLKVPAAGCVTLAVKILRRSGRGDWSGKGPGVDADRPVQDPELALRAAAEAAEFADAGEIVVGADAAGRAGLELGGAGDFPPAEQLSGDRCARP